VNDVGLVGTELDTALGKLCKSCLQVEGNGLGLGVRHQASASKDGTKTTYVLHHVRGGDSHIEIHPTATDFLDQVVVTDKCGTGLASFLGLLSLGEYKYTLLGGELVGKDNRITDTLALLEGKLDADFNSLIKLGKCNILYQGCSLFERVELGAVDFLDSIAIFLSVFHLTAPPLRPCCGRFLQRSSWRPQGHLH